LCLAYGVPQYRYDGRVRGMPPPTESTYSGPRRGDVVDVELRGEVVEMRGRGGVPGVIIELVTGSITHYMWVPLSSTFVVEQRAGA
jgi:hypothetical protein